MLLSWREHWHVALSPTRVDVVRVHGLIRRRVSSTELLPCHPAAQEEPWRAALTALEQAFTESGAGRKECEIVLSNHFVRYTLVPWESGISDEDEIENYARLRFNETYGAEAVAKWDVQVGTPVYGAPRLACAVDRNLMEALRAVCAAQRVRLRGVRPLLVASFDRCRKLLRGPRFWFATAEDGRLCLAGIEDYAWRTLASERMGRNLEGALRGAFEREALVMPTVSGDALYLFARDLPAEQRIDIPGMSVCKLVPPFVPVTSGEELAVSRVIL